MTKTLERLLLSTLLVATACGSSKMTTGTAGSGGGAGKGGNAGATGAAGTTGGAGETGAAGSAAAGATGADGGAGSTGTAGADAATNSDVASSTDGSTTNIKAATGGTVTAAGLTLEIPAGALAADTNITVAVSDGAGLPAASTLVASVYDLGPNGTTFLKPVKLTINVDSTKLGTKNPVVSYLAAGAWVALTDSMTAAGGKVVASTTHFTSFGVVGSDAAACIAMEKTSCQACCKTTFARGLNAPLNLAIKACGCKAGSPCETQCAGNVCASQAVTTACQMCLNTAGSATPTSACIKESQLECTTDAECKAYSLCAASCGKAPVDASAGDSSTDSVSEAPAACTVGFTDSAPVFAINKVATDVPPATGGTIVPGLYWLTEQVEYTGPGGATGTTAGNYSETFQITANEWNADITLGGMHYPQKTSYTVSGTTFTVTRVCPAGNPIAPLAYSVDGNSIRFTTVGATGAGSSARVLVRQP